MTDKKRCAACKVSGYWKGFPCGNEGKFEGPDGKWYCYAHIGLAIKEPERLVVKKEDK